jgi:hypothetical protein
MSALAGKEIPHGEAARRLVLAGIKPIGDLMKASLGPKGRDAVIDTGFGPREVTRAAPAAAKEILLRQGNQLMRAAISATSDAAGDGTATAAVLAQAIYSDGSELITRGHDALELRRGIESAVGAVVAHVTGAARPVTGALDLARVATSSARGERRLGEVVARALDLAGERGVLRIEDAADGETTLAVLSDGVLVIRPGSLREVGPKERRALIDSAIRSSRAAVEDGFVAGGGVALLRAQAALDRLDLGGDQRLGVQIVRRALEEPLRQIATNAGADGARVAAHVQREHGVFGYDAMTGRYGDLVDLGIIDPTKTVRSALEHAAAAACALLGSGAWQLTPTQPVQRAPAAPAPLAAAAPLSSRPPSPTERPEKPDSEPPPTIRKRRSTRPPRGGPGAQARAEEAEAPSITRYPSIRRDGEVHAGAPLVLNIDLHGSLEHRSAVESSRVKGLPEGWTALSIQVRVAGSRVVFAPGCDHGFVVVRRDRASAPCTVVCTVAPDATEVEIIATFFYNGRYCGEARRAFPVAGRGAATTSPLAGLQQYPGRVVVVEPWVPPPDMTVRIFRCKHDPPGLFGWHIELPNPEQIDALPVERTGEKLSSSAPERWALGLLERLDDDALGSPRVRLDGVGDALYDATPACFQEAYRALEAHHGGGFSIQLICDDPFVPWELMRPRREDGTALPPLFLRHPVARWVPGRPRRALIERGEAVTVVPAYARGALGELPAAAQAQAAVFARELGARPVGARKREVSSLLENRVEGRISFLYVAARRAAGGDLLHLEDEDLAPSDVRRPETMLGRRAGTFVLLSACGAGVPGGWPGAFIEREFGGCLASISGAWEQEAERFVEGFVERVFRRRVPVGKALCELRNALPSPAALAYVYYGDVMARFEGAPRPG